VDALYDQREIYRREIPDLESRLNGMGYSLLGEKKDLQAVAVFNLNTELFPASANTYDSLGEAYLLSGNIPLAIANYEKALELNPESENARKMLDHLRKGDIWDRENRIWIG
jgi:tetratricopeptide (TPR) repeat protein